MTISPRQILVSGIAGLTFSGFGMLGARVIVGHEPLSGTPQIICLAAGVIGLVTLLVLYFWPKSKSRIER